MNTQTCCGLIVNEGHIIRGTIEIEGDRIKSVTPASRQDDADEVFILPGIIDTHVHFREPGLTHKACIESESRAAAYGGVTTYFDMPNTVPQTTTPESLAEKQRLAGLSSHINYSFFYGATNDNVHTFDDLDRRYIPGIKLFMGSSTGNMLVDRSETLQEIFRTASELGLPLMAHCEDTDTINRNMAEAQLSYGDDPPCFLHPLIRSEEACYKSTLEATSLAKVYGTQLHVAHISTARELEFFGQFRNITAEAVVAHLLFTNRDYEELGTRIKCNPSIKSPTDRDALREALTSGQITTIATDHAPHLSSEKEGGCKKAASGMPMVQFSLSAMLGLVDEGILSIERLVELMCHQPARLFRLSERGFIRPGYKADLVIVRPHAPWTLTKDVIQSRCGWSPLEGHTFQWRVEKTICNGHAVYDLHRPVPFDADYHGEAARFEC
ncbi:MAG: dihydroorotase [Prevotella sp.]|nr:dihydroorotase [Prevotella sp.]